MCKLCISVYLDCEFILYDVRNTKINMAMSAVSPHTSTSLQTPFLHITLQLALAFYSCSLLVQTEIEQSWIYLSFYLLLCACVPYGSVCLSVQRAFRKWIFRISSLIPTTKRRRWCVYCAKYIYIYISHSNKHSFT